MQVFGEGQYKGNEEMVLCILGDGMMIIHFVCFFFCFFFVFFLFIYFFFGFMYFG